MKMLACRIPRKPLKDYLGGVKNRLADLEKLRANSPPSSMGDFKRIEYNTKPLLTMLQQERDNADPRLIASIMGNGASSSAIYNNDSSTTINLDVGDITVHVPSTNASLKDIGTTVQNGVINGISHAQYMLLYRSVGGIA